MPWLCFLQAIIDTVVLRVGDTVAAALFQILDSRTELEPARAAAVASVIAGAMAVVAYTLGQQQQRRARQMAAEALKGATV
jgi:Na+-driven multidrug efflux pump